MRRRWTVAAALVALSGVAAAPRLAVLAAVEPGQWQLREAGGTTRLVCADEPVQLLQVAHPGAACGRFVVEDAANTLTVHYTCPRAGHGRTTLTRETQRLLRIQTSGIADGAPFEFDYEARRLGACPR